MQKSTGNSFFNRIAYPQPADVLKTNFLRIVFLWIWQNFYEQLFFSISIFFHRHWQFKGQQRKGGGHLLFHSTTSTCSQTLRSLFATLQVRWLSCTFNRTACIYQTSEIYHLYLLNYHLIDWWCNVNFFTCLLDDLILGFWTALLHTASEQLLRRFTRK